ncbi:MAG: GDP-mannose 4,6-dehydratase [Candidatus Binatia bacterium]
MRCLVTGIAGFTGKHLADFLLQQEEVEVAGLVRSSDVSLPGVRISIVDVTNQRALLQVFRQLWPDFVFHLAVIARNASLQEMVRVNVLGTENVLAAAAEVGSTVLLPGSAAEYGRAQTSLVAERHPIAPINEYGVSKAAQVMLARQRFLSRGVSAYIARVFNVVGPGQPRNFACADIAERALRLSVSGRLRVDNAAASRDFIDVRDVCEAYWHIVTRGRPGEIYNVCTGEEHTFGEVGKMLLELCGKQACTIDKGLLDSNVVPAMVGDPSKIRKDTGWTPKRSLRSALEDVLAYQRVQMGR